MVQMVELDDVPRALVRRVAPGPSHRNGRVVKAVNVVVRDGVAAALPHPYADRGRGYQAQGVHVVVAHRILEVLLRLVGAHRGFADLDAPAAEVENLVGGDPVAPASASE